MSQTITLHFLSSLMHGMKLKHFSPDEYRDHGAPCSLQFLPGGMQEEHAWTCARTILDMLNITPDDLNLRQVEINKTSSWGSFPNGWDFPNQRNHHILASDYYINAIQREDLAIVADKVMREMRAMGLITSNDYIAALGMLETQGLPTTPYLGHYYKPGTESEHGWLPPATQRYIEEASCYNAVIRKPAGLTATL